MYSLDASDNALINNPLTINGNVHINGTLDVSGITTLNDLLNYNYFETNNYTFYNENFITQFQMIFFRIGNQVSMVVSSDNIDINISGSFQDLISGKYDGSDVNILPHWIFPVMDTSGDTLAIIRPLKVRIDGSVDNDAEIRVFSNTISLHTPNWDSTSNGGLYVQSVSWDINDLEEVPAP